LTPHRTTNKVVINDKKALHNRWPRPHLRRPNQPTIHKNLALLFTQQGKTDEAIQHYRQVLKYRPNDTDAYNNLEALLAIQKKSATENKTPK
jgi:Flp pilus assembly protein TadD